MAVVVEDRGHDHEPADEAGREADCDHRRTMEIEQPRQSHPLLEELEAQRRERGTDETGERESDTALGLNRIVAMTITGQCHRYVPYDTRPRYTALGDESARFTTPPRETSSATISAQVVTVAATPRWIAPRWIVDVRDQHEDGEIERREQLHRSAPAARDPHRRVA